MAAEIAEALARVRERVGRARARSSYNQDVTILAVSKTVELHRIRDAFRAGQEAFGENRVQEAMPKIEALPEACWHLVGHLQSNKARDAAEAFAVIQSVDSLRLAQRLETLAEHAGKRLAVLFEINVAGEASKHGFGPQAFLEAAPQLLALGHLEPRGLMTVAPLVADPDLARPVFRRLRELRDEIRDRRGPASFAELSMGMTGDFEVAIEEGATMVRIGRAIFGERGPVGTGLT